MLILIRRWFVSLLVLFLVSLIISYIVGDEPIFILAIWIFFGLIIVSWILRVSSALTNFLNYKVFGDDISNRLADTLTAAGGMPKPEKFAFDIDEYLLEVRHSEEVPKQQALLASELIGLRDGMKTSGQYVALMVNSKILEQTLSKLHSD